MASEQPIEVSSLLEWDDVVTRIHEGVAKKPPLTLQECLQDQLIQELFPSMFTSMTRYFVADTVPRRRIESKSSHLC